MTDTTELTNAVGATAWYHTIDLPGGVTTPGYYDLRKVVAKVLPDDLSGKRCLDAATASGFWAFEMEKRGASEVVAIDVTSVKDRDWQFEWEAREDPTIMQHSFTVARDALGSKVDWRECNLYDVSPDRLGMFDFVFIGTVLIHLRDPVKVLRALRTVTAGEMRSFEEHLLLGSLLHPRSPHGKFAKVKASRWWTPNAAAHRRWVQAAGFEIKETSGRLFQPFGPQFPKQPPRRVLHNAASLRFWLGPRWIGAPAGWVSAVPIPAAQRSG